MTEEFAKTHPIPQQSLVKVQWKRYVFMVLLANAGIWGATLGYLKVVKPSYLSQWALIFPGSTSGVNLNLPDIGQASSSETSPFGGGSTDPRANYQYLATSEGVLEAAASAVKLPVEKFGKPRIKLVDNTTILQFEISGESAHQAQKKALALNQSLMKQLDTLRAEEVVRRDVGTQSILKSAQEKLRSAQAKLSQFKERSGLNSNDQVSNLAINIEQLRKKRAESLAQERQSAQRLEELTRNLAVAPKQASEAFVLQADQIFQLSLKTYSEATANLEVLLSKWGPNHPQVVKELARQQTAEAALLERSQALLGRPVEQKDLAFLQLGSSNASGGGREGLFQQLVTVQADQRGFDAEAKALKQEITKLESRLSDLAQKASQLDRLQRDVQVAEAVFASTVTKLDLGKGNIYSSYPLVQIFREPTVEKKPSSPKTTLILAGAAAGSLLTSVGLALIGVRNHRVRLALAAVKS